jgi:hypothetical protein
MLYEPGSAQCRALIDCKSQIEAMLLALQRIENSGPIQDQLRSVHLQLEDLHGRYRRPAAVAPLNAESRSANS